MEKKVQNRFKLDNLPSLKELEQKTVVMLVNTDSSIDHLEPLQPNMIQVGGMHIAEVNKLPPVGWPTFNMISFTHKFKFLQEINEFISNGKKGTILVSLASNLGSTVLMSILRAFDELPEYNFVWNFESELDAASTENVLVHKFLPQNDILAHPNVIAFISHSELLSSQEAFYHGVPMIGEHNLKLNLMRLESMKFQEFHFHHFKKGHQANQ